MSTTAGSRHVAITRMLASEAGSILVRPIARHMAGTCVVTISLSNRQSCEICTTASRSIEILAGNTIIPSRLITVFDRNGQRLLVSQLAKLDGYPD